MHSGTTCGKPGAAELIVRLAWRETERANLYENGGTCGREDRAAAFSPRCSQLYFVPHRWAVCLPSTVEVERVCRACGFVRVHRVCALCDVRC